MKKATHALGVVAKLLGAAASAAALWELWRVRKEKKDPVLLAAEVMSKKP